MTLSGFEFIAFLILAVMAISGAIAMLFSTRVIHMALAMAFTFFSIACIYLLLNAEFLAVIQILIYTGAVTIMMLFGVMLTRHKKKEELDGPAGFRSEGQSETSVGKWHGTLSLIAVILFFGVLYWIIYQTGPLPVSEFDPNQYTVELIGKEIFTHYVIPFELASVLLSVALVGAVILAKKEGK